MNRKIAGVVLATALAAGGATSGVIAAQSGCDDND